VSFKLYMHRGADDPAPTCRDHNNLARSCAVECRHCYPDKGCNVSKDTPGVIIIIDNNQCLPIPSKSYEHLDVVLRRTI